MTKGAIAILLLSGCAAEAGFMDVRPRYLASEAPLGVCVEAYDGDAHALGVVAAAIHVTNTRLGFKAIGVGEDCAIAILTGAPAERGWLDPGGTATLYTDRTSGLRCSITIANTGTDEMLSLVTQHEIGHCLGLAHDDFESSIMRTTQTPAVPMVPGRAPSWPPRITDSDRSLIRAAFGVQ